MGSKASCACWNPETLAGPGGLRFLSLLATSSQPLWKAGAEWSGCHRWGEGTSDSVSPCPEPQFLHLRNSDNGTTSRPGGQEESRECQSAHSQPVSVPATMIIVPSRLMMALASSQGFYEDKMKCRKEAAIYSFCRYLLSTYWCWVLTWALGHHRSLEEMPKDMCGCE